MSRTAASRHAGGSNGHRAGYVAIVGRPNVGKSTLLNRLVGTKISITSRKPQTTRQRITGILTRPEAQIVFVDTPGYQSKHRNALNRLMARAVVQALEEVDVIVWVIAGTRYTDEDEAVRRRLPANVPIVVAINKIDLVADKRILLPFIKETGARVAAAAIVPVSASRGTQLDDLVAAIESELPAGPPLFGPDEITTASERFLAAEIVREKLFRLLGEELPYAAAVAIDEFKETAKMRRVAVRIVVDKQSQKAIVIGKNGEKLKEIATHARRDMERLFGAKVFLEIWVNVKSGWADDEATLKRFGMGE